MCSKTNLVLVAAGAAVMMSLAQAGAIVTIHTLGQGDGFWHDETGSSYDFFESTGSAVSAHYQYFGTSDTMAYNTGYAQFNLGAVAGSTISLASLNFWVGSSYATAPTPNAGSVNHVQDASSANGLAAQRLGGNELVGVVDAGYTGSWISFDITAYLQNDIASLYDWAAFSFNPNTTGDYANRFAGFSFASAEDGSFGPYIQVVLDSATVPLPSVATLVGLGLLVFGVRLHGARP